PAGIARPAPAAAPPAAPPLTAGPRHAGPSAPPEPVAPAPQVAARPPAGPPPSRESKIGAQWLNRIGIVAVLIGVSYFLKYAFENNWIGPAGRIAIGLLAGAGVVLWSESFRKHGYRVFSYSLKAVGIGILYLSLWGAFQVYHLIPSEAAFVGMVLVTGFTATLALKDDAEIIAGSAVTTKSMTAAPPVSLIIVSGLNAVTYFLQIVAMLDYLPSKDSQPLLAWAAVAIAAIYIVLSRMIQQRLAGVKSAALIPLLYLAIAVGFLTIAVPLKMKAHWVTVGWVIESAVLMWIGERTDRDLLGYFGVGALALGVVRLVFYDNFD